MIRKASLMHSLYLLKFSSGKCYVGQTVRTMNTRLQQHRAAARRGSELPVHCAWRKHGEPEVQVLGEFDTPEQLHRAEIEAIARLGTLSPGGYNVGLGGETSPAVNPDVAQKIAKRAKGRKHADTASWSEAMRQRWKDEEYREKIRATVSESFTVERRAQISDQSRAMWEQRRAAGWSVPEEVKAKLRGRKFSEESRAKMSASAKGKKLSEETKAKIGAASSARKYGSYSEERRRKTGDAVKAAWADPVKRERLMAARKAAWETRRRKQQEQPV